MEGEKEASSGQSIIGPLQFVESNSEILPSESVYAEALTPTLTVKVKEEQEEQSVALTKHKSDIHREDAYSLTENIKHPTGKTLSTVQGSIKPSKLFDPSKKQAKVVKKEYVTQAASKAKVAEQVIEMQPSIKLIAKGGHQVYFNNSNDKQAKVVANVPSTADKYPLLEIPLAYKSSSIDLLHLSKQPIVYQQNRVHVCLPTIDEEGIGYIHIQDNGLKGGGRIRINYNELTQAIVAGYGALGREPETLADWSGFLGTFTEGLSSVDLALTPPNHPSMFDPGSMRSMFLYMASNITGRNVQLENYGEAWSRILNQARQQIRQKQNLNIDPSAYPRHSYTIVLLPNASKMRPFIGEMDRIYSASIRDNVSLDFNNILGAVDVEVVLDQDFYEFENKEIERQENERKEHIRGIVYKVSEEIDNIESSFINLKNQLEELNSEEAIKRVISALKIQHEALMKKLSILDDLAGADEETRAKRKMLVTKTTAILDETDKLLKELQEALEKQEIKKREEEEELFVNPTGKGIRNDSGGLGHFDAPRGVRRHKGLDFQSVYGQDVVSPVKGKAINSSFKNKKNIEIPTVVIIPTNPNIGFNKLELLDVGPIGGGWRSINKGDVVGQSISLQTLGYSADVGPHIHLQMKLNGEWVNPTPYFPGLT